MEMKLKIKEIGKVGILELHGHITLGSGDQALRGAVQELFEGGKNQIVINLRHAKRVDSAAVGEMVSCTRAAQAKGGSVKLAEPSQEVRDILGKFPYILLVFDSEEEAVRSF